MAQQDKKVLPNVLELFGNAEKMTRGHLAAFLQEVDEIHPIVFDFLGYP